LSNKGVETVKKLIAAVFVKLLIPKIYIVEGEV